MTITEALKGATVTKVEANIGGAMVDVTSLYERDGGECYIPLPRRPLPEGMLADVAARVGRREALARMVPAHPAFKWQVNGALLAHRRGDDGVTACGRTGELTVVVDDDVPPCPKCFRQS